MGIYIGDARAYLGFGSSEFRSIEKPFYTILWSVTAAEERTVYSCSYYANNEQNCVTNDNILHPFSNRSVLVQGSNLTLFRYKYNPEPDYECWRTHKLTIMKFNSSEIALQKSTSAKEHHTRISDVYYNQSSGCIQSTLVPIEGGRCNDKLKFTFTYKVVLKSQQDESFHKSFSNAFSGDDLDTNKFEFCSINLSDSLPSTFVVKDVKVDVSVQDSMDQYGLTAAESAVSTVSIPLGSWRNFVPPKNLPKTPNGSFGSRMNVGILSVSCLFTFFAI